MPNRRFLIFLFAIVFLLVIAFFWPRNRRPGKSITTFEECASAGYKVSDGYPRECTLPSGKFFVERVVPGR